MERRKMWRWHVCCDERVTGLRVRGGGQGESREEGEVGKETEKNKSEREIRGRKERWQEGKKEGKGQEMGGRKRQTERHTQKAER